LLCSCPVMLGTLKRSSGCMEEGWSVCKNITIIKKVLKCAKEQNAIYIFFENFIKTVDNNLK
jgi:hypothetical protein